MTKGEQQTVVVTAVANSGDGVGRINDKVVFIPFACPGDELLVEITQSKKNFATAKILKIISAADERKTAPCPYFGTCGGCDWQHLPYEKQLYWKKENLIQTLERVGKIDGQSLVTEIVQSPEIWNYRNRIQLHKIKDGLHYSKKGSHQKVQISECPIADKAINHFISKPKNWVKLRNGKYEFAKMSQGEVEIFPVDKKGNSKLGFRQVNTLQNQNLVDRVVEVVERKKVRKIIDLYCGQGNWSNELAQRFPEVHCIGIDSNPINIQKALKNKRPNLEFFLGDVVERFRELTPENDLVLIDPPRAGCAPELFELLESNKPSDLLYISCHPATLARDLQKLSQQAWTIESIEAFDMFPQTSHLECLAFLHSDTLSNTAKC